VSPIIRVQFAAMLIRVKQYEEAYDILNKLYYEFANRLLFAEEVGRARRYLGLDKNEESEQAARHFVRQVHEGRMLCLHGLGSQNDAIELANYLACQDTEHHRWPQLLGLMHLERQQYEKALSSLDQALSRNQQAEGLWRYHAIALYHLNRHEEALRSIESALSERPNDHEMYCIQTDIYISMQCAEAALEAACSAVNLEPFCAHGHFQLGRVYTGYNRLDEAIDEFKTACDLSSKPGMTALYKAHLANAQIVAGQVDGALANIRESIEIDAANPMYDYLEGVCLQRMRKPDEAIACYDRALSKDFTVTSSVKRPMVELAKATALKENGQTSEAEQLLRERGYLSLVEEPEAATRVAVAIRMVDLEYPFKGLLSPN